MDKKAIYDSGFEKGFAKALKACGGCNICYGKGYSTELEGRGRAFVVRFCRCPRGKQAQKIFGSDPGFTVVK